MDLKITKYKTIKYPLTLETKFKDKRVSLTLEIYDENNFILSPKCTLKDFIRLIANDSK